MTDNLETLTGRNYLSFSSLSAYSDCSERFYHERVRSVRQEVGWWLPAGSALHLACEWLDLGAYQSPELAWQDAWRKTLKDLDEMPTKASGRATKEYPNKQDKKYWDVEGEKMVKHYDKFAHHLSETDGWSIAEINGTPAIELAVEGEFNGTKVKGYVDRVYLTPDGHHVVVDLKSSQREPISFQNDIYGALLNQMYGLNVQYGAYYMFRTGLLTELKPFNVQSHQLGRYFNSAVKGIEAGIFLPNLGPLCGTCGVRKHCSVFGDGGEDLRPTGV